MKIEFQEIINRFPGYMTELKKLPPVPTSELQNIPKRGIYVFYEDNKPIYVGRSKNLRQRFRQHGQPSSDHHSATFAFMIAKQDAEKNGVKMKKNGKNKTRKELQDDDHFSPYFINAKKRVSDMQVQVIPMEDAIEQTLFEVYAALELNTEYNKWDTH
jgi:predicted GIY-YIG superfamily endonuclease